MVNLFGNGFIGGHFAKRYNSIINDKFDLIPKIENGQILYTISTVDNYHLKTNPFIDIDTNLTLLIRVLENCRGKNLTFNFLSSWFVYGDTKLPFDEDTSYCNPKGFYSITKRTAEQLLIEYCNSYNISWRILRLANVIGKGDTKVSKKKNALTFVINELKKNNDIELYNNGKFLRDYIHVFDVCAAINIIINKGKLNTTYNVSNNCPIMFREAVLYAHASIGSKSNIKNIDSKSIGDMIMNNKKLIELNYKPVFSVYDCIDELVKG